MFENMQNQKFSNSAGYPRAEKEICWCIWLKTDSVEHHCATNCGSAAAATRKERHECQQRRGLHLPASLTPAVRWQKANNTKLFHPTFTDLRWFKTSTVHRALPAWHHSFVSILPARRLPASFSDCGCASNPIGCFSSFIAAAFCCRPLASLCLFDCSVFNKKSICARCCPGR